ncbi:MAG: thioredoxin 1 [Bacteroidia bacterium]
MKIKSTRIWLLSFIVLSMACSTSGDSIKLDAASFKAELESTPDAILLDVRTSQEYGMAHIENAINIDIYSETFEADINDLDKSKTVFVYCKSGGRSGQAAKVLENNGFSNIRDLSGGMLSWDRAGYPVALSKVKPTNLSYTMEEYNAIVDSNELLLVDFMADWCGPCKRMAPSIKNLQEKYGDKLTVLKVNVDHNRALSEHFKISGIPMVKVYHKGEQIHSKINYHSQEEMEAIIQPYL